MKYGGKRKNDKLEKVQIKYIRVELLNVEWWTSNFQN